MKKLSKPLLKGIISFALAIALVMGAVPIDGLVMVAKAETTISKLYVGGSGEVTSTGEISNTGASSGKASVSLEDGSVVLTLNNTVMPEMLKRHYRLHIC